MDKSNFLRDREVAIIAYAEQKNERKSNKTPYDQCAGVMVKLLRQTGLKPADIDEVVTRVDSDRIVDQVHGRNVDHPWA